MDFIHFGVYFHYSLHFLNIEVWLRTVTDKNSSCMQITRDHADADIPWFWQTGFGWAASMAAPIRMKEQSWSLVNLPLPHISRQIWRIIAGYEQLLKKERQTSVSILCWITLQNTLYMDFNLLMLINEFAVTTMDSQEPTCCNKRIWCHEINPHEINSHKMNFYEINSYKIKFLRDKLPRDQLPQDQLLSDYET